MNFECSWNLWKAVLHFNLLILLPMPSCLMIFSSNEIFSDGWWLTTWTRQDKTSNVVKIVFSQKHLYTHISQSDNSQLWERSREISPLGLVHPTMHHNLNYRTGLLLGTDIQLAGRSLCLPKPSIVVTQRIIPSCGTSSNMIMSIDSPAPDTMGNDPPYV